MYHQDDALPMPVGDWQSAYMGGSGLGGNPNRQVVAQLSKAVTTNEPPRWDGTPANFDLWSKKVLDWSGAVKLPVKNQGAAVLASLPDKPKERLRQEVNQPRLCSINWRTSVGITDHQYHWTFKNNN